MNRVVLRRTAAAVVIATALVAGTPAHAARRPDSPAALNVLERAWQWVSSFWGGEKIGMDIDPNGALAVPTGETGGRQTEIGILIDPNG